MTVGRVSLSAGLRESPAYRRLRRVNAYIGRINRMGRLPENSVFTARWTDFVEAPYGDECMICWKLGKGPFRAWRAAAVAAALSVLLLVLAACGGSNGSGSAKGLLTVVRVEERLEDGSWAPLSGAKVTFEVFLASGPTLVSAGNVVKFEDYEAVAGPNGISTVLRIAEGKLPKDIGMVFARVELPDGRTQFRRIKSEENFDFKSWYRKFGGEEASDATIVGHMCESAIDFPNCAEALTQSGLTTWGAGLLLRVR